MTKIAVFAYGLVGHACLKALVNQGETISGVFTHPDTPGENLWFPSVAQLAKDYGLPLLTTEGAKDPTVLEALQERQPDLLLSFYYRKMIPSVILDIPRLGCFNMHGSFLPRYRGRAPINWVLVHGETETGATLHHMVKSADAGAIVDQEAFTIELTDTAVDLTHKMAATAVVVLRRQLSALKEGRAPAFPQDETCSTYFGGRTAQDSRIDWRQSAWQIHNLIRAVPYPYFPAAFTTYKGEKVEIRSNRLPEVQPLESFFQPGQILAKGDGWVRIACGGGNEFLDVTSLSCPFGTLHVGDVLGGFIDN